MPILTLDLNQSGTSRVQAVPFTGDPDWALNQSYDLVVDAGVVAIAPNRGTRSLAFTIELYDAAGAKLTGDRGSFVITPVKVRANDKTVHDASALAGGLAWRRYIVDDVHAAEGVGIRITNPTIPAGTAEIRVVTEVLGVVP